MGFVLNDAKTGLILQNNDNVKTVINLNIVKKYIRLVKSAVRSEKFCPTPIPSGIPLVILPARMLKDKGVHEFVAVAKRIKSRGINRLFFW